MDTLIIFPQSGNLRSKCQFQIYTYVALTVTQDFSTIKWPLCKSNFLLCQTATTLLNQNLLTSHNCSYQLTNYSTSDPGGLYFCCVNTPTLEIFDRWYSSGRMASWLYFLVYTNLECHLSQICTIRTQGRSLSCFRSILQAWSLQLLPISQCNHCLVVLIF